MSDVLPSPPGREEALMFARAMHAPGVAKHLGGMFTPSLVEATASQAIAWHNHLVADGCAPFESVSAKRARGDNPYSPLDATQSPEFDADELAHLCEPEPSSFDALQSLVIVGALRLVISPDGRRLSTGHASHQAAEYLSAQSPDKAERLFLEAVVLPLMQQAASEG